ncbi:hypothetical protein D3C72_2395320 [compost metagenome]
MLMPYLCGKVQLTCSYPLLSAAYPFAEYRCGAAWRIASVPILIVNTVYMY